MDLDLKNSQTRLRDLVWFFDILDLKSAGTTFTGVRLILWYSGLGMNLFWFYYTLDLDCGLIKWVNQGEMSLEKYEDLLELSVKQFVMQSNPFFPRSDNVRCKKNQTLMLLVTKLVIFLYRTRLVFV